jgi:hypothetical protein
VSICPDLSVYRSNRQIFSFQVIDEPPVRTLIFSAFFSYGEGIGVGTRVTNKIQHWPKLVWEKNSRERLLPKGSTPALVFDRKWFICITEELNHWRMLPGKED